MIYFLSNTNKSILKDFEIKTPHTIQTKRLDPDTTHNCSALIVEKALPWRHKAKIENKRIC